LTKRAQRLFAAALLPLIFALLATPAEAQRSLSGETRMRLMLEELNNVGSVMMIAAHPDDENTALLAYLARGRHVRTAYLSLTRGEGGQNLIGSEQSDELGIIRTQELLAARKIDGAEQYFTRAIDFGFTKTADETLKTKWPREKVLGDVVWAIRRFRPDAIILRFSGTPRDGHGQHQASAILGKEAFSLAGDPTKFPEQLKYVKTWQPLRLMTNIANFNAEQQKEIDAMPDKLEIDLGAYSPELGYSYNEIAGASRSQHRSQAMGTPERKGEVKNYFVTNAGDKATKDILEGINVTWSRLQGGAPITEMVNQALASFVPSRPEAMIPSLLKIRAAMVGVPNATKDPIATRKLKDLDEAIALAAGISVDALTDKGSVSPGGTTRITLTALSRNPGEVTLLGAKLEGMDSVPQPQIATAVLVPNKPRQYPVNVKIPETQPYTQPYWLRLPKDGAMYSIADAEKIGDPENAPLMNAEFRLRVGGEEITLTRPVENHYVDRVYGELTRPLAIVPPVGIEFGGLPLVFAENKSRRVDVPLKANTGKTSGDLHLEVPSGWHVTPASQHFDLAAANEQVSLAFELTPPGGESQGLLRAVAKVGDREITSNTRVIDYPHIPTQTLFPPADAKLVRVELKNLAKNVGYVMGAGDEVPEALRQMGCEVTLLTKDDLLRGDLSRFDAIVTGVRAWNTRADLRANYQRLYKYAEDGGTVIVQYNVPEGQPVGQAAANRPANPAAAGNGSSSSSGTAPASGTAPTSGAAPTPAAASASGEAPAPPAGIGPPPGDPTLLDHIGPYPIKESRDNKDRVTVEEAPVAFPNPQLALLHAPNEITQKDFEGWVQERGLNFAVEWDPRYQSVFESHDPGDKPMLGGELYTKYGKGAYIFSSYSWFRQLPAGVPGAYRLFANMLSASKVQ
jgi:LmbE family N-acetylglucosaminyl deacetylase